MTRREKFDALVTKNPIDSIARARERIKNRTQLRASQQIAIKVLSKLDELEWTQKKLADELEVTPQQVTKIVSGKENLTLRTIVKLEEVLDIQILTDFKPKKETL